MRKFLKNLFILNVYFFTGAIVLDTYGKVCEIRNFEKIFVEVITEAQKNVNKETQN